MVLFNVGVKIHELGNFMFVSVGSPILRSMVLAYKAWAQCPSVISHGYIAKPNSVPKGYTCTYNRVRISLLVTDGIATSIDRTSV